MQKVIFLDIDGVLNPKYWRKENNHSQDQYGNVFNPDAVANLAEIIDKTGAKIVISSSWKCMGLTKLQQMWKRRKLPGEIIDVTPDYMSDDLLLNEDMTELNYLYRRGCEIKGWMIQHGKDVSHYAIIDDMDDILPEQQDHLIWIDPHDGITSFNAKQIIATLNMPPH